MRLAEFGACMRNEPSGALMGLFRARAFVQDDAHVFCTPAQVEDEVARFCDLLGSIYADFGFANVEVRFSTRPAERAGAEAAWDEAEVRLAAAAGAAGLAPVLQPGEGAFYGPKLEFHLTDCRGRSWQCGTIQVDLVLPERLDARYVDADDRRARPVILHHAVLGSLERFIGILLEHHAGNLPLWLAPVQFVIATISDVQADYADHVAKVLAGAGYRVEVDRRSERLAKKVAEAHAAGIPLLIAVGAREAAVGSVSLRHRDGAREVLDLAAVAGRFRGEAFR